MRTKLTVAAVLAVLAALLGLFLLQDRIPDTVAEGDRKTRVAVLTLGPFPLLDMILAEVKAGLERSTDPKVEVVVFNPNFQQELLRKSCRDMVAGDFAAMIALSTPATQMLVAENAGRKPLVFAFVSTPAEIGLGEGQSLPNVTGFIDTVPLQRNFELIRRLVHDGARVGYVVNDGEAPARSTFESAAAVAATAGLGLRKIPVSSASEVRPAVAPVIGDVDCLFFGPDSVAASAADLLVGLAAEKGKPVFCTDRVSVARGCVACVAPDYAGLGKRVAEYALAVVAGKSPADLPVVDFDEYATYLNERAASSVSLVVPADLRSEATVVSSESTP